MPYDEAAGEEAGERDVLERLQAAADGARGRPDPELVGGLIARGVGRAAPPGARRVAAFVGMPGAGKSTLLEKVVKRIPGEVLHPGSWAAATGRVTAETLAAGSTNGELLPDVTTGFLRAVATAPGPVTYLDGFPRSASQALSLAEAVSDHGWRLVVVLLTFPAGTEVFRSFSRQRARGVARAAKNESPGKSVAKITRALRHDLPVAESLAAAGVRLVVADGTSKTSSIVSAIADAVSGDDS